MSANPLTPEEREANLASTRLTTSERDLIEHYEATIAHELVGLADRLRAAEERVADLLARSDALSHERTTGPDALRIQVGRLAYANGVRDALAILTDDDAARGES